MASEMIIRGNLKELYKDIYTSETLSALSFLSHFNNDVKTLMNVRLKRRAERQQKKQRIAFLDPESVIPRTNIKVRDAREGRFDGSLIPHDLHRQWIQGTGPAAKPKVYVGNALDWRYSKTVLFPSDVVFSISPLATTLRFDGQLILIESVALSSGLSLQTTH